MKQFKVYENPQGVYEAVKQGWSWPAFFFSWIWELIAEMWGLGVLVVTGMILLWFVVGASGPGEGGEALVIGDSYTFPRLS